MGTARRPYRHDRLVPRDAPRATPRDGRAEVGAIDQAQGRFDPFFQLNNNWNRVDQPQAAFNPVTGSFITGAQVNQYDMNMSLTKINPLGGQWDFGVNVLNQQFPHSVLPPSLLPLNPQTAANTFFGYTQPFLKGAGMRASTTPPRMTCSAMPISSPSTSSLATARAAW